MTDYMKKSRAEVLYHLDHLIRHVNDEDHQENWLVNGIPDDVYANAKDLTDEQREPYFDFVEDTDDGCGYQDFVKLAVRMLYRECFKVVYEKESLV